MRTGRYSISEQEIGKATVNIPTTQKSAAQKHVARDEQELEQGITKENWQNENKLIKILKYLLQTTNIYAKLKPS